MESDREPSEAGGRSPAVRWLLEGGIDCWDQLVDAVGHCLDELVAGGVLEVISCVPDIELDIAGWCTHAGHDVLQVLDEGASTRIWIQKGAMGQGDTNRIAGTSAPTVEKSAAAEAVPPLSRWFPRHTRAR